MARPRVRTAVRAQQGAGPLHPVPRSPSNKSSSSFRNSIGTASRGSSCPHSTVLVRRSNGSASRCPTRSSYRHRLYGVPAATAPPKPGAPTAPCGTVLTASPFSHRVIVVFVYDGNGFYNGNGAESGNGSVGSFNCILFIINCSVGSFFYFWRPSARVAPGPDTPDYGRSAERIGCTRTRRSSESSNPHLHQPPIPLSVAVVGGVDGERPPAAMVVSAIWRSCLLG